MPIVNFHLLEGSTTAEQDEQLLAGACRLYAEVLEAPMDRIRAFITPHRPGQFAVAGRLVAASGVHAPFFDFIVLEGRSLEQRQRLLAGFTDLLVNVLGVRRQDVRGCCRRVSPEEWSIGGVPASEVRKSEVEARARAEAASGSH
jgi:4-oxalocrotonate tautomerase